MIPAAIKEYLGGAEDLVQNRDRFVDLIGDVLFAVPSVIVARHHRGETQGLCCRGSLASILVSDPFISEHGEMWTLLRVRP